MGVVSVAGATISITIAVAGVIAIAVAVAGPRARARVSVLRIPVDEVGVGEHGELLLEGGAALLGRHILGDLVQVRDVLRHVDAVTSPAVVHHFWRGS